MCCELAVQRNVWIRVFVEGSGNELQNQGAFIYLIDWSFCSSRFLIENMSNLCMYVFVCGLKSSFSQLRSM